jgi:hypothetical protein
MADHKTSDLPLSKRNDDLGADGDKSSPTNALIRVGFRDGKNDGDFEKSATG